MPTTRKQPALPPETKLSILKAIREAKEPLKPAAIVNLADAPRKVTGAEIHKLLEGEEQIFKWGTAYWNRDQTTEARNRLLAASATGALTETELKARAMAGSPKLTPKVLKSVWDELTAAQRFRFVAPAEGSKKKRLVDALHPEPYLESEIARLLKEFGRERPSSQIQAFLTNSEAAAEPVAEVAAKIFDAMNRIAFSPGTTVTFYRLRQQPELAHIPKEVFDEAALLLQRDRKALLSLHDHAAALPAEERERFVTDGLGTYYVSIYAR